MMHNDVLRRIRYIFDYDDFQMMDVFAQADAVVSREQVCAWLKPEDDEAFEKIPDRQMASFLNGLINLKRGKRDGEQPPPESVLSNNMVLMKLRIALNLQSEDVLALLCDSGLKFSKHELTALFRKPGHKHYRPCEDQILRNVLKALQMKMRGDLSGKSAVKKPAADKPDTRNSATGKAVTRKPAASKPAASKTSQSAPNAAGSEKKPPSVWGRK